MYFYAYSRHGGSTNPNGYISLTPHPRTLTLDPRQFKILLDYMYNKPISVPSSQMVDLLSLANQYQVPRGSFGSTSEARVGVGLGWVRAKVILTLA